MDYDSSFLRRLILRTIPFDVILFSVLGLVVSKLAFFSLWEKEQKKVFERFDNEKLRNIARITYPKQQSNKFFIK